MIDFSKLIKAGLHFGHQTFRWCPKMKSFIWGQKNGVHLIDVSKIAFGLENAALFLEKLAAEDKQILFVGTKKAMSDSIKNTAYALEMPYVNYRWVGGTITNFHQVKKAVTRLLHYRDILEKSEEGLNTKKELGRMQKAAMRLENTVGGLEKLHTNLGALVIIDVKKDQTAIKEANSAGIPVIGLTDTNADPTGVDYIIPGNDNAVKGVSLILEYLTEAIQRGLKKRDEKRKELEVKKQQEEALLQKEKAAKKAKEKEEQEERKKVSEQNNKTAEKQVVNKESVNEKATHQKLNEKKEDVKTAVTKSKVTASNEKIGEKKEVEISKKNTIATKKDTVVKKDDSAKSASKITKKPVKSTIKAETSKTTTAKKTSSTVSPKKKDNKK